MWKKHVVFRCTEARKTSVQLHRTHRDGNPVCPKQEVDPEWDLQVPASKVSILQRILSSNNFFAYHFVFKILLSYKMHKYSAHRFSTHGYFTFILSCFFIGGLYPRPLFRIIFGLFKHQLRQMYKNKRGKLTSIRHSDSNSWPLYHDSPSITSSLGLLPCNYLCI